MRKHINKYLFPIAIVLFFAQALIISACSDWTETEAKDYFEPVSEEYKASLQEYYNSPHKLMFGWFGNWAGKSGASMQYSLCGLPDSVDFVSLWLVWGNLTEAQQADLKEFQERGSRAVLCWRAGDIGDNLTPAGNDDSEKEAFWGFTAGDSASCVEAARKYAMAIADTCEKYNIDGFDYDIEDWGSLMNRNMRYVANEFLRTLRSEFDKTGRMLVCDIPGGTGWLSFYDVLDNDVLEFVDYVVWQTYDLVGAGLDSFFTGSNGVKSHNPEMFETVMRKSIVTATFEEAAKKYRFGEQASYNPSCGIPHAGMGAYHIEYDYAGNPDYAAVRAAISTQNPPINK